MTDNTMMIRKCGSTFQWCDGNCAKCPATKLSYSNHTAVLDNQECLYDYKCSTKASDRRS